MRVQFRDWLCGVVFLGLAAGSAAGQGASFSGDPTLSDESIEWEWGALPGIDPYFQGNTVLEYVDDLVTSLPGAWRILESNVDGSRLYAVDDVDDTVYIIDGLTGDLVDALPAPPDRLLGIDVHRSEDLILGGLASGRIALWDRRPEAEDALVLYAAQSMACRFVQFLLDSSDPEEQQFVTAGDEDTLRVWSGPGSLLREIITSGKATALNVNDSGSRMAVGDSLGVIRIYEPASGSFKERLDEHTSPVVDLLYSSDQSALISMDDTGRLLRWNTASWTTAGFELVVEDPEVSFFGVRQPDASLIYTSDADSFRIFDGLTGRQYRSKDLVPEGTHELGTLDPLGRRIITGLSDGRLRTYRTGYCDPSPSDTICFGGYKIWRSPTPEPDDAILLRIYGFGDSTWSFSGLEREFVDPDSLIPRGGDMEAPIAGPHNGLPFYYSVTAYERQYLNGSVFDVLLNSIQDGFYRRDPTGDPTPVYAHGPDRTEKPLLGNVIVVPNPYEAGRVEWDGQLGPHVEFRNLPSQATIRVYTVSGDLLRTMEHGTGDFDEPTDARAWDLTNRSGEDVASGVYIYNVTTKLNSESKTGYFIVVR